jgi:hypothetical protein
MRLSLNGTQGAAKEADLSVRFVPCVPSVPYVPSAPSVVPFPSWTTDFTEFTDSRPRGPVCFGSDPVAPSQTQSHSVKPSRTQSGPVALSQAQSHSVRPSRTQSDPVALSQTQSHSVKPSRTQSNPVALSQTQSNHEPQITDLGTVHTSDYSCWPLVTNHWPLTSRRNSLISMFISDISTSKSLAGIKKSDMPAASR